MRNIDLSETLLEARTRFKQKRPKSLAQHIEASNSMPGGNTRTVLYHAPFPLRIVSGSGSTITDADGFEYSNFLGEFTAGVFGHSHPAIREAVASALEGGINLGAHNTAEPELARLVCERFPAIEKVRFTNSGTEANLMAVATARAITGRDKVLVFRGGYHGAMLYFGEAGNPVNAPYEFLFGNYNDPASIDKALSENSDEIACVLVEPMQGASGCIPAQPSFMHHLREQTVKHDVLLVFDEVMTSRFGRHGAHDLLNIKPDLVTLGKWVGGGMSFGAFGGKAKIMDRFDPSRPDAIPHAGTFNNNVVSMHAGIAALAEVFTSDEAEKLHARGEAFRARLNQLFAESGTNFQVTGQGSLMNIHACAGSIQSVADLRSSNHEAKELLFLDLLEEGFYIANRGFLALTLALSDLELEQFETTLGDVLSSRAPVFQSIG